MRESERREDGRKYDLVVETASGTLGISVADGYGAYTSAVEFTINSHVQYSSHSLPFF